MLRRSERGKSGVFSLISKVLYSGLWSWWVGLYLFLCFPCGEGKFMLLRQLVYLAGCVLFTIDLYP